MCKNQPGPLQRPPVQSLFYASIFFRSLSRKGGLCRPYKDAAIVYAARKYTNLRLETYEALWPITSWKLQKSAALHHALEGRQQVQKI